MKEVTKLGLKQFLRLILINVMCFFVVISFSVLSTAVFTKYRLYGIRHFKRKQRARRAVYILLCRRRGYKKAGIHRQGLYSKRIENTFYAFGNGQCGFSYRFADILPFDTYIVYLPESLAVRNEGQQFG